MATITEIFCQRCGKTQKDKEFYGSNNLEKYPDGKLHICKKCITMKVDNWNPDTFLWILQECDVPYIPDEWSKLLETYASDPSKVSGMTIMGRYLSKMKLKQFRDYRWKDTEFLQEVANNKVEQAMKRQGFGAAEIAQQLAKTQIEIPEEGFAEPVSWDSAAPLAAFFEPEPAEDEFVSDLTEEDKTYLKLKWGKAYKPSEWVALEKFYQEMMESYDIQGAGHEDILKMVCKTSLKSNQLLDIGDVDGAQKMLKMYDSLMKSGKFTAAQNKAENGEAVDSISELVEMCEKQGYIERFYVDKPNDKVDLTLKDMQRYTSSLIEGESNLTNMIEAALRQNAKEDKDAAENQETEIVDDDDLFEDIEKQLTDQDFQDFYDSQEDDILDDLLSQGGEK